MVEHGLHRYCCAGVFVQGFSILKCKFSVEHCNKIVMLSYPQNLITRHLYGISFSSI